MAGVVLLLEELELGVLDELLLLAPLDISLEDEDDGVVLLGVVLEEDEGVVTEESVDAGVVVL